MVLAEALLRVPDARTADQLIEDKLGEGDFIHHETKSDGVPGHRLGLGARPVGARHPARRDAGRHHRPAREAARRAGRAHRHAPGDAADGQSFRARPDHRARRWSAAAALRPEAALLLRHARRRRAHGEPTPSAISTPTPSAIEAIGQAAGNHPLPDRPGISVKLSALHPRYEAISRERVMAELVPQLLELARQRQGIRPQLHRRCRGGRPARAVARRHRGNARRSLARRLGRLRPRDPGLSEARQRGDRLCRRACAGASTGS